MNKLTKQALNNTPVSDNDIILKNLKLLKADLEMQLKELSYIIAKQEQLK